MTDSYDKKKYLKYKLKYLNLRDSQIAGTGVPLVSCSPNNLLKVYFNSKEIKFGQKMKLTEVEFEPIIEFDPKGKLYTILMVDPDAPSKQSPTHRYWLHMMKINNSEVVVSFNRSDPPKGTGYHRYYFYLLEQPHKFSSKDFPYATGGPFDVARFIEHHQLKIVSCTMYKTECCLPN